MKRNVRKSALAVIAIAALLVPPINVPADYDTITEALTHAVPGSTILVAASYNPDVDGDGDIEPDTGDEQFPILVQKDNITIIASGTVLIAGNADSPVFVVGAYRQFDPVTDLYVPQRVSGVTIEGFTIGIDPTDLDLPMSPIGILVKEAKTVTIKNNTIYGTGEGIRLLDSTGCTISGNTISGIGRIIDYGPPITLTFNGIGIFLERSANNTLTNNTVMLCGLGLFIFESAGNTVSASTFTLNVNGGIVLNDSADNLLTGLTVTDNGKGLDINVEPTGAPMAWGIRFVFSDGNALAESLVSYNGLGGVELVGSQNNSIGGLWKGQMLNGNTILSNGAANDGYRDPQVVVTSGDKAIFTSDVFAAYNLLGNLPEFVEEKQEANDKLDLLKFWTEDLDLELYEIRQKIASAIGMIDTGGDPTDFINDSIIVEKHFITNVQSDSGIINRGFWENTNNASHRPSAMEDPMKNFTLEAAKTAFRYGVTGLTYDKLDFYQDGLQTTGANGSGTLGTVSAPEDDFGLKYDNDVLVTPENADHITADKLNIMRILVSALSGEIYNEYTASWPTGWFESGSEGKCVDSLMEKVDWLADKGLITPDDGDPLTPDDQSDLNEKLNAIIGYIAQINGVIDGIEDDLSTGEIDPTVDDLLEAAITNIGTEQARIDLLDAKSLVEGIIADKQEIYGLILDIRYKLCLVDLELPPLPRVNSILVGKKEKPFEEIGTCEIDGMETAISSALSAFAGSHPYAAAILTAVDAGATWEDITTVPISLRASSGNTIANNIITSDLISMDGNVGIILDGRVNTLVNNLFTNEWIPELAGLLRYISASTITEDYSENLRLDVAILLYGDENLIRYNAIKFINTGMERGGERKWRDFQNEYVFSSLAKVAYWPGPGFETPESCADGTTGHPGVQYGAEHFAFRWVDYLPVLSVTSRDVSVDQTEATLGEGNGVSVRVKRNRIEDNFFDNNGVGIYVIDAESNHIEQNLFYQSNSGALVFGVNSADFMPNIILKHNDYYGGISVVNRTTLPVAADQDYTPAGAGNAPSMGLVTGPSTTGGPYAYVNFTQAKLISLGIGEYFGTTDEPLPPNLALLGMSITLPPYDPDNPYSGWEPRHPDHIFLQTHPTPGGATCCDLETGWNLISLPVDPDNPDPTVVFLDDPLYLCTYNTAIGDFEWVDKPPSATAGTAGALTTVSALGGYWLASETGGQFCVTGTALTGDQVVALATLGWYMIGVPYDTAWGDAPGAAVKFTRDGVDKWLTDAVAAGWLYGTILSWDATADEFIRTTVETGTRLRSPLIRANSSSVTTRTRSPMSTPRRLR
jgi:parallel beta-helix repeat protein